MASGPITSWQIEGEKVEVVIDFFWGALKSLWMVTAAMKSEDVYFLAGKLCKPRQSVERQRYYSSNKVVKVMVFPVVTYDYEI